MTVERKLTEFLVQKINDRGIEKYYENLTNWLNVLNTFLR